MNLFKDQGSFLLEINRQNKMIYTLETHLSEILSTIIFLFNKCKKGKTPNELEYESIESINYTFIFDFTTIHNINPYWMRLPEYLDYKRL